MFLHEFRYAFKDNIRQKEVIFWMMIFPVVLATFFKMAFGNIYSTDEVFSEIKVAVVSENTDAPDYAVFKSVMDETDMFIPEYTDSGTALEKLKAGSISGIIEVSGKLSVKVAANGLVSSIIKSFAEQYEAQKTVLTDIAVNDPQKMNAAAEALSSEINCIETKDIGSKNMDEFVSYFFNLLAMVALFAASSGVFAAVSNQGNLSDIGARKCISPTNRLISMLAGLLSAYVTQLFCNILSITYILFVLKINMGGNYVMLYITGALTPLVGTALGFFIGSVGTASQEKKLSLSIVVVMICCFFSGLMVGDMKGIVAEKAPIMNKLNPAALISDLYYCLMIYDSYDRYLETIAIMLGMTVLFMAGGFLLTRRKKYASI